MLPYDLIDSIEFHRICAFCAHLRLWQQRVEAMPGHNGMTARSTPTRRAQANKNKHAKYRVNNKSGAPSAWYGRLSKFHWPSSTPVSHRHRPPGPMQFGMQCPAWVATSALHTTVAKTDAPVALVPLIPPPPLQIKQYAQRLHVWAKSSAKSDIACQPTTAHQYRDAVAAPLRKHRASNNAMCNLRVARNQFSWVDAPTA